MTVALVHYPVFTGEMQIHTRRIIYYVTLLCGWDTEKGTVISTDPAVVTCTGCRDTLAGVSRHSEAGSRLP